MKMAFHQPTHVAHDVDRVALVFPSRLATWVAGFHQIANYRCAVIIVYHRLIPVYRSDRNNIPLTNGAFISVHHSLRGSQITAEVYASSRLYNAPCIALHHASSYLLVARASACVSFCSACCSARVINSAAFGSN